MPAVAGRCPPCGVHPYGASSGAGLSTHPAEPVRCPAVRCPPVRHAAVWCLPVCLSCRVRLLPRQPGGGVGTRSVRPGTPARPERVEFSVVGHVCGRLGRRLEQAWTQARLPRSCVSTGERRRGLGRVVLGRRRPRSAADQAGQPGARVARGGGCASPGELGQARRCCTCRVAAVLAGCATTVGGRGGACPPEWTVRKAQWACQRGWRAAPARPKAASKRARLAAGSAVTCGFGQWACQDLNLGPHPYQQTAGNRCADRRFRRSRPTVEAKVMRSIGTMVCVLTWCRDAL
jgi:hypothetical protein